MDNVGSLCDFSKEDLSIKLLGMIIFQNKILKGIIIQAYHFLKHRLCHRIIRGLTTTDKVTLSFLNLVSPGHDTGLRIHDLSGMMLILLLLAELARPTRNGI